MKLLYAENEKCIPKAVLNMLKQNGYTVDSVSDGEAALDFAQAENYDGIILNSSMSKINGYEVIKTLRKLGNTASVLLITDSQKNEDEKECGLVCHYIKKPFTAGELILWIRNELCIGDEKFSDISDIIKFGNVSVSLRERTLFTGEKIIAPPRAEYIIMELLMLSGGSYISAHDMLSEIGRYNTNAAMGLVWVYISCLRKHLAYIGANIEIKLKRGVGYALALKE